MENIRIETKDLEDHKEFMMFLGPTDIPVNPNMAEIKAVDPELIPTENKED